MKLIRDKTTNLERGSSHLAYGQEYEMLLRMKLMEEASEAGSAVSTEEFIEEMADLYEVAITLMKLKKVSMADVIAAADEKRQRKGGFDSGLILVHDSLQNKRSAKSDESNIGITNLNSGRAGTGTTTPTVMIDFMDDQFANDIMYKNNRSTYDRSHLCEVCLGELNDIEAASSSITSDNETFDTFEIGDIVEFTTWNSSGQRFAFEKSQVMGTVVDIIFQLDSSDFSVIDDHPDQVYVIKDNKTNFIYWRTGVNLKLSKPDEDFPEYVNDSWL